MSDLQDYVKNFNPMSQDNERYIPEDCATLQYSRVAVLANGEWVGASLHPKHVTMTVMNTLATTEKEN